ncbi:MAG: efflux RND transporter permease subunit [Myxococcales bacterium]|nr:efflux RND transporter permease subunit [Myxococcales bacterium]
MKIAELAVKNPQFTLVVFAMLAALGVNSFLTIPRSEDPQFPIPGFAIVAIYPGASPVDVEELVSNPIEEELNELEGIKKLQATIAESVVLVRIEFDADSDADKKEQEVRRQIEAVRQSLPKDLLSLDVVRFSTTNVSLVQVGFVSATAPWTELETHADALAERFEAVAGVKDTVVHGLPDRQVRIELDVEKLARHQIPFDQVLGAIQSDNTTIPGGSIELAGRRLGIKTSGAARNLSDLKRIVIGGDGRGVVHLADVAEVRWDEAPHEIRARYDGQRAVFVAATQKPGQNVFALQIGLHAAIAETQSSLPPNITLGTGFDQAENVDARLGRLYHDFLFAIALVLITLLPLGFRAALVVMIAIPLSLAIGLTLLDAADFNLNQLSIVGFVIALGLLVDDSIVVVENITRFLREGHSRKDAAILATRQIAVAVLGCTATLVFAFVPLLFLPGSAGDFIRSLPMAVVLTILASLIVSITIVPFLASLVLPRESHEHGNWLLRAMTRGIEASYRPVLGFALRNRVLTLLLASALVAGSVMLIPKIGFSLFPKAGTRQFLVRVETPDGTGLEQTDAVVKKVEQVLAETPEVDWTMASVGKGNPQVYYNVQQKPESPNYGEVFAQLREFDPASSPALYDTLRDQLAGVAGARIDLLEFENGPPIDAPIAIRLLGDDLGELTAAARQVERIIAGTPGTRNVTNPYRSERTDLVAEVNYDKAGMVGVPTAQVARAVRLAVTGLAIGTLRDPSGDDFPIEVSLPGARQSLEALSRLPIPTVTGGTVPFDDVAKVEFRASPTSIQHHGAKQRAVTVTAHVQTGENTDRITRQVLAALEKETFPAGMRWTAAGEIESRSESFGGLGTAILVATFMVLAILVLEFKTFRGTLVVASVIPLGVLGGLVALYVTGYTLSFTAIVGFIALIGIEIKNSILLVDFTNALREEGRSLDDAIRTAGEVRFLPIVLTTLTAIGGLMPLAIQGSSLYSPLAWVIIGGLISSTLLSRLVTPVMYHLLSPRDHAPEPAAPLQPALS